MIEFISLGRRDYASVLNQQFDLKSRRQSGEVGDTILTVEHPKVITQGRRPAWEDFRLSPGELREQGFAVERVNRGGRLTYHGPGQLVAYFIISLKGYGFSVPQFVRAVEETAIRCLELFGVSGQRRQNFPGVWVDDRKIVSIGLSVDRGVSMHGLALNINPDLKDFEAIIPCGMPHCEMTSLYRESTHRPNFQEVEKAFVEKTRAYFGALSESKN